MVRIAGVELQDNLRLIYALTKIKGIGFSLSEKIVSAANLEKDTKVSGLTSQEVTKLTSEVEKYGVEGDLLRAVKRNIQRLKTIGAYRGVRHGKNLPVRGQRTRSNARTKRGKRKTVGAFKKEALAKFEKGTQSGER